jgi:peptidoglycan/LPS O-acetylase OafA/YrhL
VFAGTLALAALLTGLARDLLVTCSFFFLLVSVTRFEESGGLERLERIPGTGLLLRLGSISYGVYLAHGPAFILSKRLLVALHVPNIAILGLRFGAGILAGALVYVFIEKRCVALSQRILVPFTTPSRKRFPVEA